MVAFEFNASYQSMLVFLSAIIPGIAIGWPLLKGTKLSFAEKFMLSFFIGLFAPPTLLFLEGLLGLKFSLFAVIADIFVLTAAGILWGMKNGAFEIRLPRFDAGKALAEPLEAAKKAAPGALLLLAVFLSFWIRVQTYSPIYSELDPYWYVYSTGLLLQEGVVPVTDDTAWWPEVTSSHRTVPLKVYLEAQWYSLYTKGGAYSNYLLFTVASWLPPVAAGMLAFGAYLLISSVYGRRYGIFAAFLMAFLPGTIFKMSAGVNEAAPAGMMMIMLATGLLAYALVHKDRALKLLAAFAFFVAVAASNVQYVVAIPFAGLMVLQSVEYFVRGKHDLHFVETGLYALAGLLAGTVAAQSLYFGIGLQSLLSGTIIISAGSVALAAAVYYSLEKFKPDAKRRWTVVAACAVLGCSAIFFTPLGNVVKDQVKGYVGAVDFNTALERTIAEQNRAGSSFEGEAGFLALVPANHADAARMKTSWPDAAVFWIFGVDQASLVPSDLPTMAIGLATAPVSIAANIVLGLFNYFQPAGSSTYGNPTFATPFTWLANTFFSLLDFVFRLFAGTKDTTDAKDSSLLFVFLVVSLPGLAYGHFSRKGENREIPSVFLLILLITVPVIYVGINKIKFTVYVGMMAVALAAVAFAETEKLLHWLARRLEKAELERYVAWAFSGLLLLTVYAQAAGPVGYGGIILSKSFETRYQDDPAGMAPKMAALCENLRAKGVDYSQIQGICEAGIGPEYASTMNRQFDYTLCWLSQMNMDEVFPGNSTADARRATEAVTAARFRCNRLADYWVDSMEWIKANLGADDRLNSWWDYGHWTNYLGEKKTVLRNEHASRGMIGRVAHDFIIGSTQDLIDSMNYFDSRYVLFDVELIGGSSFGGKYGALNYLGCVHEGDTDINQAPGTSDCEFDHSPERVVIPKIQVAENTCVISESQQLKGAIAYRVGKNGVDPAQPAYCIGETVLKNGETVTATYYMDKRDAEGNLALSKGFIRTIGEQGDYSVVEMVYNEQPVWQGPNGTWVGGYEDAKTAFYRSNLYRGFYLEDLPGFELAYKSANGEIKIYRMKDFKGNKAGTIDKAAAAMKN